MLLFEQVSWIRRRDFQLLTVGLSTYSSDDRFLVEHARHMGHWSLRIKSVRDDDRGLYECQLSIHPTQSIFIELKVVGEYESFFSTVRAPSGEHQKPSGIVLAIRAICACSRPTNRRAEKKNRNLLQKAEVSAMNV